MKTFFLLTALALLLFCDSTHAGSGTWSLNPLNGDWNTAENWTPAGVPTDTATFAASNVTDISVSAFLTGVGSITFNPGAGAFTITALANSDLDFAGGGIINNSGIPQNFVAAADESGDYGEFVFIGNAAVGDLVQFTAMAGGFASVQFQENSSAGSGTFVNIGGSTAGATGGFTLFSYNSTADHATISNKAADANGAEGGLTIFYDSSRAARAIITCEGADVNGGGGGVVEFLDRSDAGNALLTANGGANGGSGGIIHFFESTAVNNATVIANGGSNGGGGGTIFLEGATDGGTSRVEVFGNGNLDLIGRTNQNLAIGSLEGDGEVFLVATHLSVGSNSLTTVFSGAIQDVGSLTKVGSGTLALAGANTYTGGTTVNDGTLLVNRSGSSGTGPGPVQVSAGTLGGNGTIAGTVTIGTGNGPGAFLAPGKAATRFITLRIQSSLTLKADATYSYRLSTRKVTADEVVANGVTIESGTQFKFQQLGNKRLTPGTSFTAINNTSSNPITGTFANLPDGSTLTANPNRFQVSYEGGTGNDLTLTVVP